MLQIDGVRKAFGEVQALDGVSLTVRPGEVFGFLGANGAGKTTTMRIVLGFLRADAGTVTWKDRPANDLAAAGLGLHAGGARALPADAGHRAARLLRVALRHVAVASAQGGARLAPPLPDRGVRRPEGREPVQGQPAEGPVHRDHPPRPRRPADGRAVRRARPGQRGHAQVGLHRDARSRQDDPVQHPPARPGRGAVRLGRDHRPRPASSPPGRRARSSARPATRSSEWRRPATATATGCCRCRTSR